MGACSNLSPVEKCLAIIAHGAHALLDGNLTLAESVFRVGLAMELGNRRDVFHTFQIRSTNTFSSTIPIDIINNLCHAAFLFHGPAGLTLLALSQLHQPPRCPLFIVKFPHSDKPHDLGSTPSYDANGNVLNDFLHTYSWNADGRPITIDGVSVTYDALGRMVERNNSGTFSEIVYAPTGAKIEIMNGQSYVKSFAPLPGGAMAVWSNGIGWYRHSDHLGSSRFASTSTRTMYSDVAYAPFGEPYAQKGSTDLSFTGQNQDTVSNLYDFPAREYGIQGRWASPDPAGTAAVNPENPQSWNRYAYVLNNPLALVDPIGLSDCPDLKATCGDIFGDPGGAAGVGLFLGPSNPGNGCDPVVDIECETNQEIARDVRAQNAFGFTTLNVLLTAASDYRQSVAEDEARQEAKLPWEYIIVHCSGPGNDSWECSPFGPYAQLLEPGWSPFFSNDDARLRYIGRGVVAGAGGIGDPRFIADFYAASFGTPAIGAAAADISLVEEGQIFGTRFGGNTLLLNSTDSLRVGWSHIRSTGEYVFRIGGDWIGGGHINLWPPSWWF